MTQERSVEQDTISMLFTLRRDDDPDLYDDLVRFKQGYRRVNRLRLLVHDGLKSQARDKPMPPEPKTGISPQVAERTLESLEPLID